MLFPQPDAPITVIISFFSAENDRYIGSGRDVYEKSAGIQARARAKYREMSERFSDTVIIPCTENGAMRPPETISNAVFELLRERGLI